ncbi:DUF433 domain-containing protein [Roseofilum casamattae]|uniref:DUF433 domain-containing protein n=1 Tax=Roseofilum casamattae BLCC-M143 TaxID=3022442 RepID=A0ABT7BRW9_9CYAN|nr:DUF433 domain-containing protein [Roseofilum casamattae]MDJ1181935.1 DUF433 domain-containing protein [Roseofilum casamattae BLCC-M143]
MQLEDFFDFHASYDIRIKGTRVGIENILYEYIYHHKTAEEISKLYPNVLLVNIYATILYFLHNPEDVTQYMSDWLNYCRESEQKQLDNPPEHILRLRKLLSERKLGQWKSNI